MTRRQPHPPPFEVILLHSKAQPQFWVTSPKKLVGSSQEKVAFAKEQLWGGEGEAGLDLAEAGSSLPHSTVSLELGAGVYRG